MKTIKALPVIAEFIFVAWALLSFINVIAHNLEPHPVYASWNMFELFIKFVH